MEMKKSLLLASVASIAMMGCAIPMQQKPTTSVEHVQPIEVNPVNILKVVTLQYTYSKDSKCTEIDAFAKYLGKWAAGVRIDGLRDILIEDTREAKRNENDEPKHNCKIIALGVQYDVSTGPTPTKPQPKTKPKAKAPVQDEPQPEETETAEPSNGSAENE